MCGAGRLPAGYQVSIPRFQGRFLSCHPLAKLGKLKPCSLAKLLDFRLKEISHQMIFFDALADPLLLVQIQDVVVYEHGVAAWIKLRSSRADDAVLRIFDLFGSVLRRLTENARTVPEIAQEQPTVGKVTCRCFKRSGQIMITLLVAQHMKHR